MNIGVLTHCGHAFCSPCFLRWRREGHANCPTCKSPIESNGYKSTKVATEEAKAEKEEIIEKQRKRSAFIVQGDTFEVPVDLSHLDEETVRKIQDMDSVFPLSSKSAFIVKHVRYLRS